MAEEPKSLGEWRSKALALEEELNTLREDYNEFKRKWK